MANGPSTKAVLILMLMGIGGVGALAWYVKTSGTPPLIHEPAPKDESPLAQIKRPQPAETPGEDESRTDQAQTVDVPVIKDGKLTSDTTSADVPDGRNPKAFLVEQIAKALNLDHVRILGVDVHNGTAVINFAKGIDDGMSSEQEGLFLSSLQQAFAQFQDVKNLELDKEGEKLDSVGGHIDLTDGLPVTKPGGSPPPSEPKRSEP